MTGWEQHVAGNIVFRMPPAYVALLTRASAASTHALCCICHSNRCIVCGIYHPLECNVDGAVACVIAPPRIQAAIVTACARHAGYVALCRTRVQQLAITIEFRKGSGLVCGNAGVPPQQRVCRIQIQTLACCTLPPAASVIQIAGGAEITATRYA